MIFWLQYSFTGTTHQGWCTDTPNRGHFIKIKSNTKYEKKWSSVEVEDEEFDSVTRIVNSNENTLSRYLPKELSLIIQNYTHSNCLNLNLGTSIIDRHNIAPENEYLGYTYPVIPYVILTELISKLKKSKIITNPEYLKYFNHRDFCTRGSNRALPCDCYVDYEATAITLDISEVREIWFLTNNYMENYNENDIN